jgi:hypothetical protein
VKKKKERKNLRSQLHSVTVAQSTKFKETSLKKERYEMRNWEKKKRRKRRVIPIGDIGCEMERTR